MQAVARHALYLRAVERSQASRLIRYSLAVLIAAIATLLHHWFDAILGPRVPFITFYFANTLSGWLLGFGPSLLTTAAGGLAGAWFFMTPRGSFALVQAWQHFALAMYALTSFGICAIVARQRAAEQELRKALKYLEQSEDDVKHATQRSEQLLRVAEGANARDEIL